MNWLKSLRSGWDREAHAMRRSFTERPATEAAQPELLGRVSEPTIPYATQYERLRQEGPVDAVAFCLKNPDFKLTPSSAQPDAPKPLALTTETPMSILSQNVFDPLKAELSADVGPFVEDFFTDLMTAAQKLSGKLSTSTVEGQSGALAINTVVGLASMIGPTLIQSELAKITKPVPAAQPAAS